MSHRTTFEKCMAFSERGRFGWGMGYGRSRRGKMRYGSATPISGIYQRHRTAKGYKTIKMNFYRPTNPRSPTQQAWRGVMADAMAVYSLLTPEQKQEIIKEARKYRLSGPSRFAQLYLQANR